MVNISDIGHAPYVGMFACVSKLTPGHRPPFVWFNQITESCQSFCAILLLIMSYIFWFIIFVPVWYCCIIIILSYITCSTIKEIYSQYYYPLCILYHITFLSGHLNYLVYVSRRAALTCVVSVTCDTRHSYGRDINTLFHFIFKVNA